MWWFSRGRALADIKKAQEQLLGSNIDYSKFKSKEGTVINVPKLYYYTDAFIELIKKSKENRVDGFKKNRNRYIRKKLQL